MTGRRESYDLTTAAADYPERPGPPERCVVVCSHPRSGSTLLGEAIHAAGDLGCPLEYLHRGFRPTFAERWGAPDLASYVAALHRYRTDPSGVLSIKLFWPDVEAVVSEVEDRPLGPSSAPYEPRATDSRAVLDLLCDILPNPTFVYLTRRDRIRQAVSAYLAAETSAFRALPGRAEPPGESEPAYDHAAIARQLAAAEGYDARWRSFFADCAIEPYLIEYERLDREYERTMAELLAHLGRPVTPSTPRLVRQASPRSEAFVRRFVADLAAPGPA